MPFLTNSESIAHQMHERSILILSPISHHKSSWNQAITWTSVNHESFHPMTLGHTWLRRGNDHLNGPLTASVNSWWYPKFPRLAGWCLLGRMYFCVATSQKLAKRAKKRTWIIYPMRTWLQFSGTLPIKCILRHSGMIMIMLVQLASIACDDIH